MKLGSKHLAVCIDNWRLRAKVKHLQYTGEAISEAFNQMVAETAQVVAENKLLKRRVEVMKGERAFMAKRTPIIVSRARTDGIKTKIGYVTYSSAKPADRPANVCKKCESSERRKEPDQTQSRTYCLDNKFYCGQFGTCTLFKPKDM